MGILLCEQNFLDVWRRNKSVGEKLVKFCAHTNTHTHAAKLVVRLCVMYKQTRNTARCRHMVRYICRVLCTVNSMHVICTGACSPSCIRSVHVRSMQWTFFPWPRQLDTVSHPLTAFKSIYAFSLTFLTISWIAICRK